MAIELVVVLSSSTDHNYSAMATDLIRRLIASRPRLNPLTASTLQSKLLSSLKREQHNFVCHKIYDAVSELAVAVGEWSELAVPFLFHCVSSEDPRLQQVALGIYHGLLYHIAESALKRVLIECMNVVSSKEVSIAAIAVVRLFQFSPTAPKQDFLHLQPMMLKETTAAPTWNAV